MKGEKIYFHKLRLFRFKFRVENFETGLKWISLGLFYEICTRG
ncbi:hypothetical protein CWATWH0402_3846 [Crocosphaera watsonii WH 0402]|uniref:Uncharacterized protein n=1 Tax=Crocosphaera watsonii WH 0402 TaxID=1284629 RepID=T2JLQ6_CROWT|nr:hypothetical protein CWATWH0402_3846 [Crocosphaera watsonii WH 0402]